MSLFWLNIQKQSAIFMQITRERQSATHVPFKGLKALTKQVHENKMCLAESLQRISAKL